MKNRSRIFLGLIAVALSLDATLCSSTEVYRYSNEERQWFRMGQENPKQILTSLDEEAKIYDRMTRNDSKAVAARNTSSNILLGVAQNLKDPSVKNEDRISAIVRFLEHAYRHRDFRGIEMIIEDYRKNRVIYDAAIAKIADSEISKTLKQDINAYLQPQDDQ